MKTPVIVHWSIPFMRSMKVSKVGMLISSSSESSAGIVSLTKLLKSSYIDVHFSSQRSSKSASFAMGNFDRIELTTCEYSREDVGVGHRSYVGYANFQRQRYEYLELCNQRKTVLKPCTSLSMFWRLQRIFLQLQKMCCISCRDRPKRLVKQT